MEWKYFNTFIHKYLKKLSWGVGNSVVLPVIVGLVCVDWTVCVTLIIVEHQVMFATSTMVGTTFTTSTVWTASDASAFFRIYKFTQKPGGLANRQHRSNTYCWSVKRRRVAKKIITFKVSVRALLQANGQIGNPQVSGSAC